MQQNIIKELLVRVRNSSPTLFKRLQAVFFTLAALVIILILLEPLHLNLHGFEVYINWNTVLVLIGFAGMNMLPVSDPNVLQNKTDDDGLSEEDGTDTGLIGSRPDDRKP